MESRAEREKVAHSTPGIAANVGGESHLRNCNLRRFAVSAARRKRTSDSEWSQRTQSADTEATEPNTLSCSAASVSELCALCDPKDFLLKCDECGLYQKPLRNRPRMARISRILKSPIHPCYPCDPWLKSRSLRGRKSLNSMGDWYK